nr:alpha/beta hydrolase fold domain-containing protein [Sporolactobacillus pectinivorans]
MHGGGMIIGIAADSDAMVSKYVASIEINMLSVDYRLSPEYPYPILVYDCFDALKWLVKHAPELKAELDLFRNEDIAFGLDLLKAEVSVEMNLIRGVPHSFDSLAPNAPVPQRAFNERCRVLMS